MRLGLMSLIQQNWPVMAYRRNLKFLLAHFANCQAATGFTTLLASKTANLTLRSSVKLISAVLADWAALMSIRRETAILEDRLLTISGSVYLVN